MTDTFVAQLNRVMRDPNSLQYISAYIELGYMRSITPNDQWDKLELKPAESYGLGAVQNNAGVAVPAIVNAAHYIASQKGISLLEMLTNIADENLTDDEKNLVCHFAHATWMTRCLSRANELEANDPRIAHPDIRVMFTPGSEHELETYAVDISKDFHTAQWAAKGTLVVMDQLGYLC